MKAQKMKANIVIIGAGISGTSIAYHLAKKGINTILRKEQGADIQAACGQLRLHSEE